jgi:hypothetical protein
MNKTILILLTLFSASAFAESKVTTFNCQMDSKPGETFTFKMTGVGTSDADIVLTNPEDDYSGAVTTESKTDELDILVRTLNGQGSPELRELADRFEFFGDDDGIDMVWLNLFKDSGYTKGFVRMEYAGEQDYSKVSCTTATEAITEKGTP